MSKQDSYDYDLDLLFNRPTPFHQKGKPHNEKMAKMGPKVFIPKFPKIYNPNFI